MEKLAEPPDRDDEKIWTAEGIGAELNLKPRQAFYMLEQGHIKAVKVGRKWCARRGDLRKIGAIEPAE